jgi:hypothetical protein
MTVDVQESSAAAPQGTGVTRSSSSTANPKHGTHSQQHGWNHRKQQHMAAVSGGNRALSPEPPTSSRRVSSTGFSSPRRLPPHPSPSKPSKPWERHDGLDTSEPYNDVPSAWRPEHRRHRRTASWEAVTAAMGAAATTTVLDAHAHRSNAPHAPEREKSQLGVDTVDCRLRFWAQLRAHRTLAKGMRAWAAAVAAAAAEEEEEEEEEETRGADAAGSGVGEQRHTASAAAAAAGPSALAARMEAVECEMLHWREEARDRLLKLKALSRQLRETQQLQVLTQKARLFRAARWRNGRACHARRLLCACARDAHGQA